MDSIAQSDVDIAKLRQSLTQADLPEGLLERLTNHLSRLEKANTASGYRLEFDRDLEYIRFISSLPFHKSSADILDLKRTAEVLDRDHYGLRTVKDRILEYLSVLILNSRQGSNLPAPVLAFVGLVGSGKTSLAYSIAESLGRKIIRIPFGGLGSVAELRGESRIKVDAEPGILLKSIQTAGVNNPVVLLDEVDRVASEARTDLMGVLIELLDPEQNWAFLDHFVDYPFELSKVLFIATANNTGNISTAVLDRLEIIEMPSYSDEEKIVIGRDYMMPKVIKMSGLPAETVTVDEALWPQIVRPLGFDAGIRSLQRTIEGAVRRVARKVVEGNPGPYHLASDNIGEYLQ